MKLCCGTNLYASFPLETALREISALGIHAVDLWACKAICDHADPDRMTAAQIQGLLDRYEMQAVSMTLFLMPGEERRRRMRLAAELGIPVVIWEPAQSTDRPDNMTNLSPLSTAYGKKGGSFREYMDTLRQDLAYAKSLGLKVGIEVPHCYTFNEYPYQIFRTDREIGDDALTYIIAPPHADARGYDAQLVYRLVAPQRVYMLYLWDVQKGFAFPGSDRAFGDGSQQLPGGGQRDFTALIDFFAGQGFDGWYNISCHGTEGWTDLARITDGLRKARDLVVPLMEAREEHA